MRYVAFIHKDPDSEYGISFPDVPGCVSAGETVEAAIRGGMEALALHFADGEEPPAPRTPDEIMADPELADWREGATIAIVPFVRDRGSAVRVNVSLDRGLLEAIDEAAAARRMTRSAFLASAARNEIAER